MYACEGEGIYGHVFDSFSPVDSLKHSQHIQILNMRVISLQSKNL